MNSRKVILCVDDEKVILNSLRSLLSRHFGREFELEFAESGREALEIIESLDEENAELYAIITDWLMPEMKGDELLKKVQESHHVFRTIMLSGQADDTAISRAKSSAHLDHFISKPWNENDLVTKISA